MLLRCLDTFGAVDEQTQFNEFDFCQRLEYCSQEMVAADGAAAPPLSEQIFTARLELIQTFDAIKAHGDERAEVAGVLREAIASMNPNNFLVRPHLELVERFADGKAWESMSVVDLAALGDRVAKLPTGLEPEGEDVSDSDVDEAMAELGANLRDTLNVIRANRFVERLPGGSGSRTALKDLPVSNDDDIADIIAGLLPAGGLDAAG